MNIKHMADATATEKKEKQPEIDYPLDEAFKGHSIERNGVKVELKDEKILRGDFKGYHYVVPRVTKENLGEMIQFYGQDEVAAILQSDLKKNFQGVWGDNRIIEKDPDTEAIVSLQINFEGFLSEAPEFTSAGMKISDIRDKIDEKQGELGGLVQKMAANRALFQDTAFQDRLEALDKEIRNLKDREEKRSSRGKKDEATAPSVAVE